MTDETSGRPRTRRRRTFLTDLVVVLVGALVVSSLLRAFVGQLFVIPSGSMENTLQEGDRVAVTELVDVHRGEVVVFSDPGGWLEDGPTSAPSAVDRVLELVGIATASSPGHLIKRVVGMPGDTVTCCDTSGRLTVNGTSLDEAPYLYTSPSGEQLAPSDVEFSVVVPRDHVFVMGDHRDDSRDSRCHLEDASAEGEGQPAFVPVADVVGPAFAIVAPSGRATRLRVPATFGAVPSAGAPAPDRGTITVAAASC